jgi:Rhodopirellula transposase DDE domain
VLTTLGELLREQTAGNPAGPQKWVRQSVRRLSAALRRRGHEVCPNTVRALLHELGYALKANRKRFTGPPHPERDRQFAYLARQWRVFNLLGLPVISVDAKKKELIGNFKNPGRAWCRRAAEVNVHDFRDDAVTRVVPYGIYLPRLDRG